MGRTIGIDTGGTFTDVYAVDGDEVRVVKLPSTPADPARAVVAGLEALGGGRRGDRVVHGTTVALNALLTGRVARVALVTNEGFADLIEIGRQERPDIYALAPRKPEPLVPRRRRFEVDQRIWPDPDDPQRFETVAEPTGAQLADLARRVAKSGADSVAVCLLHSWADASIEARVAEALARHGLADVPITCSAALLPEHREYERFSTALVNAALVPLMHDYLGPLEERVGAGRLFVLQSSGGTLGARRAAEEPVRVILSGPAGGVVGAAQAAHEAGFDAFAALDMGGTSTDVAFHAVGAREAHRAIEPVRIAGHPVGVPTLDIHTIGCGGGSLVTVDAGGILHVGPASAGADPGPVCYGRSDVPTVTDAHVRLGHVAEGAFLGGDLKLDRERVDRAFDRLGERLGVDGVEAARGVLDVARAAMRRAIGVMTMQRGEDPARLPLVAFGGAGGLHAAALADSLGMLGALVPRHPGALSARGMTAARPIRDLAHTALAPVDAWPRARRARRFAALERQGERELVAAGAKAGAVVFERGLDLRYRGQSFELTVPESADPAAAFHDAHERLYGYRLDRDVELVCLRTRAWVPPDGERPPRPRRRPLPGRAIVGRRRAVFDRALECAVVDRAALAPGHAFEGPALIEEYSGTTVLPPGWSASVTAGGHLLLERGS